MLDKASKSNGDPFPPQKVFILVFFKVLVIKLRGHCRNKVHHQIQAFKTGGSKPYSLNSDLSFYKIKQTDSIMYFNFLVIKARRLAKFSAGREEVISLWSFNAHLSSKPSYWF